MTKKWLMLVLGSSLCLFGLATADSTSEIEELQAIIAKKKNDVIEYQLDWPSGPPGTHDIITDPKRDDILWVSGPTHDAIAKVKTNGKAKFYAMPTGSFPHGLAYDYKGRLWVTLENLGFVVRVNEKGVIQESIDVRIGTNNPGPHGFTASLDGKFLWFTGKNLSTVGKVDIMNGTAINFPLPTPNATPVYIVEGNDGKFYCTEFTGNNIAQITKDGDIIEFPVPTANSGPLVIVRSPNKKSLWFTEETAHQVTKIKFNGDMTEYRVPKVQSNDLLGAIVFDPDNNMWLASYVNPNNPTPSGPDFLVKVDKDILKASNGNISNIPFTYHAVPGQDSVLHRMTIGPDKNLWFTELTLDRVGKLILGGHKEHKPPLTERCEEGCNT